MTYKQGMSFEKNGWKHQNFWKLNMLNIFEKLVMIIPDYPNVRDGINHRFAKASIPRNSQNTILITASTSHLILTSNARKKFVLRKAAKKTFIQ